MENSKKILIIILSFFILCSEASAYTQIFYEDCEKSDYTDFFLEFHYGTNYETYWDELTSEVSRSTISYSKNYSMVYNPIVTENPHAYTGTGSATYGNISDFSYADYNNRYWYFRWYQRWEDSTYTGYVKIWYLGCGGDYYYIAKSGDTSSIIMISEEYGGDTLTTHNGSFYSPGLDDETWHKIEVFIDFGTFGDTNGDTWIKVDNVEVYSATGLDFITQSSPVDCVSWPATSSGTLSGSQKTWLDDLEAYTLTDANDIPPELDTAFLKINGNIKPVGVTIR